MYKRVKKESNIGFSLVGIMFVFWVYLSIFGNENIFQQVSVRAASSPSSSVQISNSTTVFDSLKNRASASVNDTVSDYKIKSCTYVLHSDGDKMQFCIAEFSGRTTGFYDTAKEQMVVSDFNAPTLVHEIFHATSLHYINKGMTNFAGHEEQEKMAYNAEFLFEQIMDYKKDLIAMQTSKKLANYYKTKK